MCRICALLIQNYQLWLHVECQSCAESVCQCVIVELTVYACGVLYCETNIDFWMQECINRVVALEQMGKAVGLHVSRPASYFLKF